MTNNIELTIDCLKRAIEIVRNSQHANSIHIEVDTTIDFMPTLTYEIYEVAPNHKGA